MADLDEGQEVIEQSDSDINSDSLDDEVLGQTADDNVGVDAGAIPTPYEMFCSDYNQGLSTIRLTGDFSMPESFKINRDVVIEGGGYTISGDHKTNIFYAVNGCKLTLNNINFINGNGKAGGAVYCNGNLVLDSCTFKNNVATERGGAVLQMNGQLTVTNCKFENNAVSGTSANAAGGGAIFARESTSTISKSSFTSNEAKGSGGDGGAVYCNGNLALDDCTFKNNFAKERGGAVLQMSKRLTVTNCQFERNTVTSTGSKGNGGAIFTRDSSSSISNSKFISNEAIAKSLSKASQASKYKFNGGAISYGSGSNHVLTECTFSSNKASNYGGAVYVSGSLNVKKSTFNSNKASFEDAGAIYCSGNLVLDGCSFTSNNAYSYGGAILHRSGKLTVTGCNFQSNMVTNGGSKGYGGAIWTYSSSSSISKSTFKNNGAISKSLKKHSKATKYKFNGGAIAYSEGSSHSLTQCTFSGNKASNHGGSIFVYKSKSLSIKKCTFTNNRAGFEDGGAISFAGKKMTISNSNFANNLAYEDGGAIDSYSLTSKKIYITVKNCQFTSNTAYKCGGAIWMGVKTVYKVSNSKFIKNKASSAGAIEAESGSTKLTKCLFKSNKAAKITKWTVKTKSGGRLSHSGGAILVKNKCTVVKCKFKGNKAKYGKNIKVEGGKVKRK